jgi:hypothetical protein
MLIVSMKEDLRLNNNSTVTMKTILIGTFRLLISITNTIEFIALT